MDRTVRVDQVTQSLVQPFLPRSPPLSPSGLPDTVILGMPHLSAAGLSEVWLLKELGHRHWFLLAEAAGMRTPDFRDDAGEPVYAAFCALSIRGGDFGSVRENDVLALSSDLVRLSRTQVASRHRLAVNGRPAGVVDLISTFVRRAAGGGNHTVVRITVDGLPPARSTAPGADLAALAAAFRAGRVGAHMGFAPAASTELACATFEPCPGQDFNGAGFLYFTSFLAFVDRAEWQFDRQNALGATSVRRDVVYRGNIDPGEAIRVSLLGMRPMARGFAHHCRIARRTDGAVIADVFSFRRTGG